MAHIALATAGIVLPPLLKVFFERMASHEFDDFFRERKLSDKLLRKLKIALLTVNAVLEDAEDRQFTETSVKDWLDELKGTLYDIEDILDEIATKDFRRTITSKVRHPISASHFVNKIEGEINVAFEILEDLAKQIGVLGLRASAGGQSLERLPTTSFVEESGIFGRHEDEEAIIKSLFSNEASGSEIGVIVIVGMGGIGKTTLAQLVYNDNRVKEHFDLKAWVCVSDPFDVFMVMKTIIEEIGLSTNADSTNLNHLQINLKKMLTGKRFLFVLDDVWDKNNAKWEVLSNALKSGIQGSRVIVTTRDQEVARVVHASATHRITELPKEDCWSLFAKFAFHDGHPDAYPKLEAIGRQIVEKCKGLPLAIKAIGSLLWSKLDVDEWDNVFRSELWDLSVEETGILPALRLSYKYLSSHLKRCFAYCSIFPKDYTFKKDKLILLWMAEGLLPQPKNKTMEEVGDDYFLALVSRSLFQRSSRNKYIMHDLVSDLAKFISKQFALSLEDDYSHEVRRRTRHFSYYCEKVHLMNFETFYEAKRLRTILELNFFRNGLFIRRGVQFLLPMRRCLRVLILCYHADIAKLPNSIGKLIHLRFLDLSYTGIKRLPDSLCKLCNLQILNLSHCRFLAALPRDTHKLINLRHLNFAETCIKEMPTNLGKLKCLQTLTKFIVGEIDSGSSIGELQTLTNLRGSLSIFGLQNVECPADAKDKNMRDMKYLVELVLEWKLGTNASESHIIVLDSLQPHSNLQSLTINQYGGKSFPNWVGHASFSNIASLRLEYCKFCCSLPPLGQLPSLQDLSIVGLDGVVTIGREFYGSGSSSIKPFVALKFVRFEKMLKWEEWFSFDAENEGGAFPNLRELKIYRCPNFAYFLKGGFRAPNLKDFRVIDCGRLPSLPDKMHILLPSLEKLYIEDCPKVESFPEGGLPSNLNEISISNCDKLFARRTGWGLQKLLCVRRFSIGDKSEDVEFFPDEGLLPASLTYLHIEGFPNLKSLDKKGLQHLTTLAELEIEWCPKLECMPEDGLPASLTTVNISFCPLLEKEWDMKREK